MSETDRILNAVEVNLRTDYINDPNNVLIIREFLNDIRKCVYVIAKVLAEAKKEER